MQTSVLYLCYQSLFEPLTQTQVVTYLEGLARAGYGVVLLTFEPAPPKPADARAWRERLAALGIAWHWRRYHKRPTVPATAFDVAVGVAAGWRLACRYRVRLLHARGHVPGLMALALARLTGARFLFDIRGFLAEEYVDAGVWPAGGRLFRLTKRVERRLVRAADGYVVLTDQARDLLDRWYPREVRGKPLEVIPCCIDRRRLPPANGARAPAAGRTVAYVGKLGGWYLTDEMAGFVAAARDVIPGLRWRVWTQSDPVGLRRAARSAGLDGSLDVGRAAPEDVARDLAHADAGLSFVKPCLSKRASSPTKVAEYLAAGLPVAATAGVGDTERVLAGTADGGRPVGVLVRDFSPAGYAAAARELRRLLDDPDTPGRCRAAAAAHFDLERVGWARYRVLYARLLPH